VPERNGAIRIDVPVATDNGAPIIGLVRAAFTPEKRDVNYTMGEATWYPPVDANDPNATLTVSDGVTSKTTTIPRAAWSMKGNVVTMQAGFEAGRNTRWSTRRRIRR
jgi:hypothetical protein